MKIFKILAWVLGGLVGLLLLAILIIPFIIDVDKYRPQIVQMANDRIHGKLDLGKLQLSLWGHIRVKVDGFSLADAAGGKVLAGKDLSFDLPFTSILAGAPQLNFLMEQPEVHVTKNKQGKMNVLTLMKEAPAGKAPETPPAGEAPSGGGAPKELPGIVTRARLGIEIRRALLSYRDDVTGLSTQIKNLSFVARNVSMTSPTDVEIVAEMDANMGKELVTKGAAKATGQVVPRTTGGNLEGAKVVLKIDLSDLEIVYGQLFRKNKGVAILGDLGLDWTKEKTQLENFSAQFAHAQLKGTGTVLTPAEAEPQFDIQFDSNDIGLKPWGELVPMLKDYGLGGTAHLKGNFKGTAAKPDYNARLSLKAVTVSHEMLKAPAEISGDVQVVTDAVERIDLNVKAPGNQLKVTGRVASFTKPQVTLGFDSPGMDLDQWVKFPPPAAKGSAGGTATTAAGTPGSQKAAGKAGGEDMDALVDPLRKNPMLAHTGVNSRFNLKMVKAYGIAMNDMNGAFTMKGLDMSLDSFQMGLWGGKLRSAFATQLAPKTPTYRFSAQVENLDLKQAVSSQLQLFKDTLIGKANFKIDGSGASFNPEPAKGNLNAKGNMRVEQATFATIDIGKMASEAVNKSIGQVAQKVPALQGKTLQAPPNIESKYESVTSDFTISGGRFSAPNFFAKAQPNRGLDVKGETTLGIQDYSVNASWEIIDTYNLTQARNLNLDIAGTRIEHVLAEGNNPVRLPIRVTGNAFAPQISYTSVPEALAKVAANNVGQAAERRAKEEVKKAADQQLERLKQQAPAPIQDALKGLQNLF